MTTVNGEITLLLSSHRQGDEAAGSELAGLIYPQLRKLAQDYLRGERADHTLQPTALVNEVYLRLGNQQDKDWKNRAHFLAVSATIMRQVLVDYARMRRSKKRGGGVPKVALDSLQLVAEGRPEKMMALDEALLRLSKLDARQSRIVELRFFGGLSDEEIAEVLDISKRTVQREWQYARAWLYSQVGR